MTASYTTGQVILTNGSATVTGVLTAWQTALIAGGVIYPEADGNPLPILSVDGDLAITAATKWTGATGTYDYALVRDTAYLQQVSKNSSTLAQLIAALAAGTVFKYDADGDLAGRSTYDERPKGFGYLVDLGVSQPQLYIKASATSGDWSGPFNYGTGPTGPAPNLSIGTVDTTDQAGATVTGSNPNYTLNLHLPRGDKGYKGWTIEPELVADGARSVLRVASFIGGEGAAPSGAGLYVGVTGLVSNIADAVDIRGTTGPQGPRGVQWRAAWSASTAYSLGDLVSDNDSGGSNAIWIAIATNTNLRPRDNPASWAFFPGSFPQTLDDGVWNDPITETNDDGVWGA